MRVSRKVRHRKERDLGRKAERERERERERAQSIPMTATFNRLQSWRRNFF